MATFRSEFELLPHTIDHYARFKPDLIYAEYPRSLNTVDDGYCPVTYRSLANAVNGIAWWMNKTLGQGDGQVLAYLGPNDIRYPALVLGAVKAGYCMFLTSPRNSTAAHKSLLSDLNCSRMLVASSKSPSLEALLLATPLEIYKIPSVDDLLNEEYPHFDYQGIYNRNLNDRLVILHTSGSTGTPKPITWTLDTANANMRMDALKAPYGFESRGSRARGKRQFLSLPPFHAAGLASMLVINVYSEITIVIPPAGVLTGPLMVEAMKQTQVDIALLVPSIVNEVSRSPDLLQFCSQNLEYIAYCGGDLPQSVGDAVASKMKLLNQYGATEIGFLNTIFPVENTGEQMESPKDWKYLHFHPSQGIEMRRVTDHEYELVLVRTPSSESHQPPFTIFPERSEYPTNDLFVRHPDEKKPDLWRPAGRADDVVVLLNGEKTNPVSMEQHIAASYPETSGVLVAGAQRFQTCLLLEFADKKLDSRGRVSAIKKIWPVIEQANKLCPSHARISRTHVLFTVPEKPMLRTAKGTISRAATTALYEDEINALYAGADEFDMPLRIDSLGSGTAFDRKKVYDFILQSLDSIMELGSIRIEAADNFFELGFDSLQAITLARVIKHGLALPFLTPSFVYSHPSLIGLVDAIMNLVKGGAVSKELAPEVRLRERDSVLKEYLDLLDPTDEQSQNSPHVVLLTGSTGHLGTHILNALLKHPSVSHVHCLNRRANGQEIQQQKIDFYNLGISLDSSQATFWEVDLTQRDLGLDSESLNHLRKHTTLVIHNAWNKNFNIPLSAFRQDLTGVVNLIDLTASTVKLATLFFISSISSVLGHKAASLLTPEELVTTTSAAQNGYANSKYIAEHLIGEAVSKKSIRASIARVGQIAGAIRAPGLWDKSEWFPSLVTSALHIGALPSSIGPVLGRIDWMPIDVLADVLVDLALGSHSSAENDSLQVWHPHNLHVKTWEDIRGSVAETLSKVSGKDIGLLELSRWIARVRSDLETPGGLSTTSAGDVGLGDYLEKNPAAKLLDFWEDTVDSMEEIPSILDTARTSDCSRKLHEVDAIKPEWIEKWVREWLQ